MKKNLAEKIFVPVNERPRCIVDGCDRPGQHMGRYRVDGSPSFRKRCEKHHAEHQAAKKGQTARQWTNSFHPYRSMRKDYCENIDGRLGFTCTANIVWEGMLDVDHIDENPANNDPDNLQTLCKNCHSYKGNQFTKENGITPGRKTLGITY
jgi:5-methylcytosine-specific restriction endonuclease McrA